MNSSEPQRRSLQEDSVPTDWSYVKTVEEGLRQRQAQNIGENRQEPRIRHRAEPTPVQPSGTPEVARSVSPAVSGDSPFILPEHAIRHSAAQEEIQPTEPAAAQPAATPSAPAQQKPRRRAQIVTEDGSQFDKPATPQVPEWYRVAQQNVTPDSVRKPPAPRVQAPPVQEEQPAMHPLIGYGTRAQQQKPLRQADIYAAAGYPPELLEEQRRLDALEEVEQLRKRRGAMSVLPESNTKAPQQSGYSYPLPRSQQPQRRPLTDAEQAARARAMERYAAPLRPGSTGMDTPYTVTAEEPTPEDEARPRFPWLGAVVAILLLASVFLWLNRISTGKELEKVYTARAQAAQQVVDEHPYHYRELIEAQAEQYNLHPAFVASIVLNESSFRPGVKSSADAMGLMQIRPDTGTYISRGLDVHDYSHDMLYDPEVNIRFGCYYLGELSQRFGGDPVLVAAAYNAGPTNVQNWLNNSLYSADKRTIPIDNIPYGDTQTYARRVLRDFAAYKRLYYETPEGEL